MGGILTADILALIVAIGLVAGLGNGLLLVLLHRYLMPCTSATSHPRISFKEIEGPPHIE